MKNIKQIIIEKAKKLFNEKGVSNVSIREISREIGISHSNLIYHFKDKNSLINALHQLILENAIELNDEIEKEENTLRGLFISTIKGFEIICDFRFFMIDFNLILKENKKLHKQILEIEVLRFSMYEEKINTMIAKNILKEELIKGESANLIQHIRVFSDYWLPSAQVYEVNVNMSINKYAKLFLSLFYPYLTKKGKENFNSLLLEFQL